MVDRREEIVGLLEQEMTQTGARKYAYEFKVPFLADYELRGTSQDVEQIYAILTKRWQQVNA